MSAASRLLVKHRRYQLLHKRKQTNLEEKVHLKIKLVKKLKKNETNKPIDVLLPTVQEKLCTSEKKDTKNAADEIIFQSASLLIAELARKHETRNNHIQPNEGIRRDQI